MSEDTFLYLTTLGRTSGSPRWVELWFVEEAGRLFVVAETRWEAGWVKNLVKQPRVWLSVGTPSDHERTMPQTPARARVIEPVGDPELVRVVSALMDAKYEWSEGLIVELEPERD